MRERPRKRQATNDDDMPELNHHKRKLHYLKQRRKLRKLQISLMRARSYIRFFMTIAIFIILIKIVGIPQWYLNKDIFKYYPNHSLEIIGNEIVTTKQIMNELQKINLPNKQIFLISTKDIEKRLIKLTPIKKIYIRRFWFPARLKIVINEREPVLGISPSPKVSTIAVFTSDNNIIGRKFLPLPKTKPYYKVLTYTDYRKWSPNHVNYLIYMAKLIETATGDKVIFIDIRNPDDVYVQLKNMRLRIGELNKTVFNRTKRIASVYSEAVKLKNDIEYVDLRWNNPVYIKLKNKDNIKRENASVDNKVNLINNESIDSANFYNLR